MPGGVVDNPCIAKDDDGDCDRTALDPLFSTFDAIAREGLGCIVDFAQGRTPASVVRPG